ncbi:MAG: NAD(P)H-hydrate dehydratase [Acidobacteriota bacterium]|nr:NAD(P)H-hydrate dehydratase [Acidobacteriota bacterium]
MADSKARKPAEITPGLLAKWPLPEPGGGSGKDERGRVLVAGGSPEMPGAVILAATAALRAGAGKLQIAVGSSTSAVVAQAVPEALVARLPETKSGGLRMAARVEELASEADAVLVGPGMAEGPDTARLLRWLIAAMSRRGVLVVDAAALLPLARDADALFALEGRAILTPHAGEMASMTGERKETIEKDPSGWARRGARRFAASIALKGAETFVADRSGRVWRNRAGNAGLAISGSGDTLSGIAAGLAARGAAPPQTAVWSVALHARAGDRLARRMGPLGFLPRELLGEIPGLMRELGSKRR